MKKIIVLMMLAVVYITAAAKVYIGGTLGIGVVNTGYKDDIAGGYDSETSCSFLFSPEVGYNFNSVWAVGGTIDLGYRSLVRHCHI